MDEELVEPEMQTVGERLRVAREEKGLSLEDVAAQTRIPRRHLESLETAEWDKLPAPTYTTGFAKSYASAVGLDRVEIGEQLRAEMGGQRSPNMAAEVFEPADPARTMPKSLVIAMIAAVILLLVVMSWLNRRSLDQSDEPNAVAAEQTAAPAPQAPAPQPAQPPAQAAQGPVVVTATGAAWVRVTDQGNILFESTMQPGQTYQVPPTASAPMLRVGAPEAVRITVGNAVAPPVGPAGQVTSNVSLKPADLMRGPAQPSGAPAAVPAPAR
jgi:cytoskeleton protein RodZ